MEQKKYKHVVVIGAPKCGTSTFHSVIDFHPEITMAIGKEINYFIKEENPKIEYEDYLTNFDISEGVKIIGEASPRYANGLTSDDCLKHIFETLSCPHIVYMVRDPLMRASSHYFHRMRMGVETGTLAEAVKSSPLYLEGSNYPKYLKLLKEQYSCSPTLIEFNSFIKSPRPLIKDFIEYLGLDSSLLPQEGVDHFNVGEKVGINAEKNPFRFMVLQITRKLVRNFRHVLPKGAKQFVKNKIAGKQGVSREGEDYQVQEKELWENHKEWFLDIKRQMTEDYGMDTSHWYKKYL